MMQFGKSYAQAVIKNSQALGKAAGREGRRGQGRGARLLEVAPGPAGLRQDQERVHREEARRVKHHQSTTGAA